MADKATSAAPESAPATATATAPAPTSGPATATSPPATSTPVVAAAATPAAAADQPVEADDANDDDDNWDADSALSAGSNASSTESINSSILNYRRLHGRTYANAKTGEYWGPNDEQQSEGLDLIHNAIDLLMGGRLCFAPINEDSPGRVLDIGTGTGIWAMDFADKYPSADVTGTDLSPIQPTWVPNNLQFEIDDCLEEWTWPENHFDLVHVRAMYGCVPDWTELDRKILRHLKPGGYFEHVEIGCLGMSDHVELPPDHVFYRWADAFYEGGRVMGRPFTVCLPGKMKAHMEEAGFVDVRETKLKLPVNTWPKDRALKDAGLMFHTGLDRDLEGFSQYMLIEVLKWSREDAVMLAAKMRQEIRKKAICPYIEVMVVYGRKPDGPM